MKLQAQITTEFIHQYGNDPAFIVRAPGRVNLIGEHTDYNDGFVLPMAIDRALWIALRPRSDRCILLHSADFEEPADFSLDGIQHGTGWTEYVKGIAWVLQKEGYPVNGWEGILAGDVPIGAGLSSSAALQLALLKAFWAVSHWDWDGADMARLAQQADHEWVGIQSGIMDQMISAEGKAGSALLIDCRSLETRLVPLPEGLRFVVLDTATRRGLVDSVYNERVAQCQAAASHFSVPALRDVSIATFEAHSSQLDEITHRRARHVITENERTLQAAEAMQRGDAVTLGQLMDASHASLRDDYEVSSRELNVMVEIAREQPGCFGARMTGAGFGGCAVALVKAGNAPGFAKQVTEAYERKTGIKPDVYICQAANGAEIIT